MAETRGGPQCSSCGESYVAPPGEDEDIEMCDRCAREAVEEVATCAKRALALAARLRACIDGEDEDEAVLALGFVVSSVMQRNDDPAEAAESFFELLKAHLSLSALPPSVDVGEEEGARQ